MAQVKVEANDEGKNEPSEKTKRGPENARRAFVSLNKAYGDVHTLEEVKEFDAQGVELFFLHEKGSFFAMNDVDVKALSRENRQRYNISAVLNTKHDPEGDEAFRGLSFVEDRNRRAEVVAQLKSVPQGMDARRQLTVFPGRGFKERFARPDKVEHYRRLGYEIVQAGTDGNPVDANAFVNAPARDGHFATRTKIGQDELILMRAPLEQHEKNRKQAHELAQRQVEAAKPSPASGLVPMDKSVPWEDA